MLIAVSGWARAGKDTIADYLVEAHGFTKLSFADPMRAALVRLNPLIHVGGHVTHLADAVKRIGWEDLKALSPEIRPYLQRLGTEVGRNMFGENFWVDLAMKEAENYDNVVFADCRFQNEANAVRNAGGEVWRVTRPGFEAANDHISEHDLDNYIEQITFTNDSTIEALESYVEDRIVGKSI
jgi:hypothetical protein